MLFHLWFRQCVVQFLSALAFRGRSRLGYLVSVRSVRENHWLEISLDCETLHASQYIRWVAKHSKSIHGLCESAVILFWQPKRSAFGCLACVYGLWASLTVRQKRQIEISVSSRALLVLIPHTLRLADFTQGLLYMLMFTQLVVISFFQNLPRHVASFKGTYV